MCDNIQIFGAIQEGWKAWKNIGRLESSEGYRKVCWLIASMATYGTDFYVAHNTFGN